MPVAVVGAHPRMSPDHFLVSSVDPLDELVMDFALDLHGNDPTLDHRHQAPGDVSRLALRLGHRAAAMTQP